MLTVHKSQAQATIAHLQKHGVSVRPGAAHGDAIDLDIPEEQMARAISIASDVSSDGAPYSVLSNGRKWLLAITESVIPFALAGIVFLFVGASWLIWPAMGLWFLWVLFRDVRGAYRSMAVPLPKQSWESAGAHTGRVQLGRLLAPFPLVVGCGLLIFLLALFGFLAGLALRAGF